MPLPGNRWPPPTPDQIRAENKDAIVAAAIQMLLSKCTESPQPGYVMVLQCDYDKLLDAARKAVVESQQ